MMYRLIILTGPSTGLRVTVESKPMVIGRDPECAIRVADEEVAKKHALIERKPDGIYIRDLGSMNRILVNQHEVHETRLKHGDVIELGLTRFLVQASVQADVTDEAYLEKRARKVALVSVAGAFLVLIVVVAGVGTLIKKADQRSNAELLESLVSESVVSSEEVSSVETMMPTPSTTAAVEGKDIEPTGIRESLQPVSDELRLVREDLAELRETMKALAVQSASQSIAAVVAPVQPVQDKPSWTPSSTLRMIKIASVEQQKFPASDEFDEMRLLNITLSPEVPAQEIDPAAIHVEVSFFDQDVSNQVSLTHAIAPNEPLTPDGPWGQEERKIVTATYLVPPGFWKSERGGAKKYYGYRIRVFYRNELQDADARPQSLLNGMTGDVTHPLESSAIETKSL